MFLIVLDGVQGFLIVSQFLVGPNAAGGGDKAGSIGDRPDLAAQRIHVQCLILLR